MKIFTTTPIEMTKWIRVGAGWPTQMDIGGNAENRNLQDQATMTDD